MIELNLKSGESGEWKLKRFTVTPQGAKIHNLREIFNGRNRFICAGEFWGLFHRGHIIMSNTPSEIDDHRKFIDNASGKVLIGGLGLGMVVKYLLQKSSITKVTVVEKSLDVIKLVAPSYVSDPRVEIINADIFEFKPTEKYDCAWFDIWGDISGSEYPEMKRLHRKYCRCVGWSDSWLRKESRKLYRESHI